MKATRKDKHAGSSTKSLKRSAPRAQPLRLMHHHPGYLRVQSDIFIGAADDSPLVTRARDAAEKVAGFLSWSFRPKTGSVVIAYKPGMLDVDEFLKHIRKGAGLRDVEDASQTKMSRAELVGSILDSVKGINQIVSQATGGRADLREVVPIALAATSVLSFVLGENRGRLPNWSSAIYHSYRIFVQWHKPEIRDREKAARRAMKSNYSEPDSDD